MVSWSGFPEIGNFLHIKMGLREGSMNMVCYQSRH